MFKFIQPISDKRKETSSKSSFPVDTLSHLGLKHIDL